MTTEPPSHDRQAAWYVDALDAIDDLVLIKGERSRLLWANRAFRDYYGMSNEELRDIVDSPQSDPDDTIQYVRDDQRVFTTGETLDVGAEPITDRNGEIRYFHTVKSPIRDASGVVLRTVGVSRIVQDEARQLGATDRRSEQKSQLSELRTLVSNIPLPMLMCDVRLRVLERSNAWDTWCGVSLPSGSDVFFDEAFERFLPVSGHLQDVIATDGQLDVRGIQATPVCGGPRVADIRARAWRLANGDVGGAILTVHDVTTAVRTREKLELANDELAQFNYRASHDLRGPLRTVLGFLDLAKGDIEAGDKDAALDLLSRSAGKVNGLSHLVTNLLELAKAEVAEHEPERVELEALVASVLCEHTAALKAAGVSATAAASGVVVDVARVRLAQSLDNLISNGIKYRDPAEDERRLVVRAGGNDESYWIDVEDNGVGFEQPERAFDVFVRERPSVPGEGLGLYLVKRHAQHMGGTLEVVSPRKPTIVRITIGKAPTNQ